MHFSGNRRENSDSHFSKKVETIFDQSRKAFSKGHPIYVETFQDILFFWVNNFSTFKLLIFSLQFWNWKLEFVNIIDS